MKRALRPAGAAEPLRRGRRASTKNTRRRRQPEEEFALPELKLPASLPEPVRRRRRGAAADDDAAPAPPEEEFKLPR